MIFVWGQKYEMLQRKCCFLGRLCKMPGYRSPAWPVLCYGSTPLAGAEGFVVVTVGGEWLGHHVSMLLFKLPSMTPTAASTLPFAALIRWCILSFASSTIAGAEG
jgi:hypothetical protein